MAAAKFCTQCGTPVRGRAARNARWYVAAVAIVGIIVVLLLPTLRVDSTSTQPPSQPAPVAAGGGATPPPLSANMRENADRLYNRVMQASQSGDSASVKQFAPMAIMAYQNSGRLDADGFYHLSVLQTAAADPAAGRASAEQILAANPSHLLGLSAAASAARSQHDDAAVRLYYQRFLDAFAAERAKPLPEYQDHAALLPGIQTEAMDFLKK